MDPTYPSPQNKLDHKKDHSYLYDVLKLVSGNGIVQLIKAVLSTIISRLFLPEFFGVLQNFSSIVNIVTVVSAFRYDQTIILPKDDQKSAIQVSISSFFLILTTPITILLTYLFKDDVARILHSPDLAKYLWLVPLNVFALGFFNIFRQWDARHRRFIRLSIAGVSNEVVAEGMTVGFGLYPLANSGSMIISRICGQIFSTLFLGIKIIREQGRFFLENTSWENIKSGIIKYKKFPLFNIWSALLNALSLYLPGIILSAFFTPTIAGYFSFGQSVLRLPVALISASISQVFLQRSAKSVHEGNFSSTVEETFKRLVVFGMFPMLIIMIIGKEIFTLFFGPEWSMAGIYSQILSLWTLAIFISTPLLNITNILERNEVDLIFAFIKLFAGAGSLIFGGLIRNINIGLILFTISGIITYGFFIFWSLTVSGIPLKRSFNHIINNLVLCFPFLGSVLIFKYFNPLPKILLTNLNFFLPDIGLILFSGIVGVIYYLIVIKRDNSINEPLRHMLKKFLH